MSKVGRKIIPWSCNEVELLKKLYPTTLVRDLVDKFPRRNKNTIAAKALSLSLPSAKLWNPREEAILKKCFTELSSKELLELLPRRSWLAIMARSERLGLRRKRNKPRLKIDECYFKKWSPNMAYILGFILADGCIIKGTYKGYSDSLKFGVQKRDDDILVKIKKELNAEHSVSYVDNAAHLSISSQKIVNDLKSLGITYRKSLNETVPKVPSKYERDFIRGVIDGDGSINFDRHGYPRLNLVGGKRTVKYTQNHFFNKFNCYSKLSKLNYSLKAKASLYSITYGSNPAKTLIGYLYKDARIFLNRKYLLAMKSKEINMKIRKNRRYHLKIKIG